MIINIILTLIDMEYQYLDFGIVNQEIIQVKNVYKDIGNFIEIVNKLIKENLLNKTFFDSIIFFIDNLLYGLNNLKLTYDKNKSILKVRRIY